MIANALLLTIAVLLAYGFWLMDQLKFMAAYKAVIFHAYGNVLLACGGCPVPERIRRVPGHQPQVLPERYGPQALPPRQAVQRRADRDARALRRRGAELRCPATSIPTIRRIRAMRLLARLVATASAEPSDTRTGRGSGDAPRPDRQEPEPRERSVLKPEREDSPRAYYVRDREYLLRESEVHTLSRTGQVPRRRSERPGKVRLCRRQRPDGAGHRAAKRAVAPDRKDPRNLGEKDTARCHADQARSRGSSGKPTGSPTTSRFITVW